MSAADVESLFAEGLELYRVGALERSEACLSEILVRDPEHFDALHLSGVIASRSGRQEAAVRLIRKALGRNMNVAPAHRHLGNALRDLGRLEDALSSYSKAIEIRTGFKEAYVNRALVLLRLQRFAAALADFERALALGAQEAEVHTYRASALIGLGRAAEALASCEAAVARYPDFVDAHVNRAAALYLLGRHAEAVASCERALAARGEHADAHAYRGAALFALWRLEPALASLDAALALQPQSAFARNVRALCLLGLQRAEESLGESERAIALRPDLADAHNTRGLALADSMRFEAAHASFDRAIGLDPRVIEPIFNKAVLYLTAGDFGRGWELYERRPAPKPKHVSMMPRWDGSQALAGRTIWIYAEQGLGDTIQFCRYAKFLAQGGARVILAVQPSLCDLLRTLGPQVEVMSLGETPPAHDYHCPLLSLPRALRLERVPACVSYLTPDSERVIRWSGRLGRAIEDGSSRERLIGIRWQGSTGRADAGRSFALSSLEPVARLAGVRLVSLQRDAGVEQLEGLPHWRVEDLSSALGGSDGFLEAAAILRCLDLVITSDTSIAHLAGALGCPTWLALKRVPDWRWMLGRSDSPWYPTMRLFRQRRPGDWTEIFESMSEELSRAP
jgi:tetratricopeptide (TPR) repeat protein